MVFVPVRYDYTANFTLVLREISYVGYHEIYARHIFAGEGQPRVDNDYVFTVF